MGAQVNIHADLGVLMQDLGVTVVAGGATCKGMLDSFDEELMSAGGPVSLSGRRTQVGPSSLIGKHISLICRTGDVALGVGSALTIDGQPHTVREAWALDDGLLTRYVCMKGAA